MEFWTEYNYKITHNERGNFIPPFIMCKICLKIISRLFLNLSLTASEISVKTGDMSFLNTQ